LDSNQLCGDYPTELTTTTGVTYDDNSIGTECCTAYPEYCVPTLEPTSQPTLMPIPSPTQVLTAAPTTLETSVLSSFYTQTAGASWTSNTNWLSGDPCTASWYGVTCASGAVTTLNFGSNALNGTIASQLGLLSRLSYYFANGNFNSGSLPSELGRCTSMQTFVVAGCSITGTLPSQIGQWTQMTSWLHLGSNSFTGKFPSQMGLMTAMSVKYYINSNHFTGSIPSEVFSTLIFFINFLNLMFDFKLFPA
jgi:hypothetical protein